MQPLGQTVAHFIHGSYSLLAREQLGEAGRSSLMWQVILERTNIFYFLDFTIHALQDDPSSRCRMNDCPDYKQSTKFSRMKCLTSCSYHICSTCKEMPVTTSTGTSSTLLLLVSSPPIWHSLHKALPMATDKVAQKKGTCKEESRRSQQKSSPD